MRSSIHPADRPCPVTEIGLPRGMGPPAHSSLEGRRRFVGRLLLAAVALVIVGAAAFAIDLPVAVWCKAHRLPGELGRLVSLCEVFGHSLSVALILVGALLLDDRLAFPRPGRIGSREASLLRLVAMTYSGGLAVDLIKATVSRVRPRAADLAAAASSFDTFGTAMLAASPGGDADLLSFPSGHSAVAAGIAAALCWQYPRGWPLFVGVAAGAALQRICSSAHYPSDTAFGAAVGLACAALCLGMPPRRQAMAVDSNR